jgi:hypothetical protein
LTGNSSRKYLIALLTLDRKIENAIEKKMVKLEKKEKRKKRRMMEIRMKQKI